MESIKETTEMKRSIVSSFHRKFDQRTPYTESDF